MTEQSPGLVMSDNELGKLVDYQLGMMFGVCAWPTLSKLWPRFIARLETCFRTVTKYPKKMTGDGGTTRMFNPYHTDLYAVALAILARTVWMEAPASRLANKVYGLNKMLHGLELMYDVEMPDAWGCGHPVGSVIGKAEIGNDFFFAQGCTVGQSRGEYPVIGHGVWMRGHSAILGRSRIGDGVELSFGTVVLNQSVPAGMVVFGQSPRVWFREPGGQGEEREDVEALGVVREEVTL